LHILLCKMPNQNTGFAIENNRYMSGYRRTFMIRK
jgi:hypothetical protein